VGSKQTPITSAYCRLGSAFQPFLFYDPSNQLKPIKKPTTPIKNSNKVNLMQLCT